MHGMSFIALIIKREKMKSINSVLLTLVCMLFAIFAMAATEQGGSGVKPQTGWTPVASFTRSDNDTFTVTDDATNQEIFVSGRPVRFRNVTSSWKYGILENYSTGTVDFDGVAMDATQDDQMQYGSFDKLYTVNIIMPGNVSVDDPYSQEIYWQKSDAQVVRVTLRADTAPTGAALTGNLEIEGTDVATSEISVTAGSTSEFDTGVTIDNSNYSLTFGEKYAITISQVGSTIPGGNPLTATVSIIEIGD